MPREVPLVLADSLRATTRAPGSSSTTSSSRRNGSRCGRISSISRRPSGSSPRRVLLAASDAGASRPGARSTSPCRPDAGDARDLLVREPEESRRTTAEALIGERRESAAASSRRRSARSAARDGIGVVASRRRPRRAERLGAADALARQRIPARVHDEAVEPGRELGLAAELAQARAELDERLLGGVPCFLEVARELGRKPVHARCVTLDEGVERRMPPPFASLADEIHVAELPVCERPPV